MKKKSKIAIIVSVVLVVVILATTLIWWFACHVPSIEGKSGALLQRKNDIGQNEMPTADKLDGAIKNSINADMSAIEMMIAGLENYYALNYSVAHQFGTVFTDTGMLKVNQNVSSIKVTKDGKRYYDNYASTAKNTLNLNIVIGEESLITADGKIDFRKGAKHNGVAEDSVNEGNLIITKLDKDLSKVYANTAEYVGVLANNPNRVIMHNFTETSISEEITITNGSGEQEVAKASAPVKDGNVYKFTLVSDKNEFYKDYLPVMNYMLKAQSGKVKTEDPICFKVEVEMWENGLIKSITLMESYGISVVGIINGTCSMDATVRFCYDKDNDDVKKYNELIENFDSPDREYKNK